MRKMQYFFKTIYVLSFVLYVGISSVFLSSCDMYNIPVRDFFENYVDGMGIEKVTLPEGIKGSDGLLCLATDSEQTFTIQLRNPQKKAFGLKYEFEGADVAALAGDTDLTYNPSADRYSAKITFSQDFLHNIDKANCDSKRLSGKIYLTDESASQIYDTCNVSARANSVPPEALGAMLQADQGVAEGSYILCFYIPVLSGTVHEKDLHKLIINDTAYYFDNEKISGGLAEIYADQDFTKPSEDFYESAPTTYPLGPDSTIYPVFPGVAGMPAEACAAVYYKTGIVLSDRDISLKITFEDDYGLSNSVTATNQIAVLDITAINDANGNPLSDGSALEADTDTRLYTISISHSGLAYYNSGESVNASPVSVTYSVREINGNPVFDGGLSEITGTGSSDSDINIDLPPGIFEIKALATKDGYIDSSELTISNVSVSCPAIFYVSFSGSDDAGGSKSKPFATVNMALSKLKDTLADDSTLTDGKICLLSDIEITEQINLTDYKFADLAPVRNITIAGYDEVRTINANSKCRVMQIGWTNGNITLENLIFKGGTSSDSQGGGGLFVSSSDASGKTLEIKNCKFVDNTTAYTGAAILINSDYTVDITDCEISGNTLNGASGSAGIEATQMGTGTYITIKDTKIIDNTVISPDTVLSAFGSALNGSAATKLNGGVTITGNIITGVSGSVDSSNYGAVNNSLGLKLSGANIIKDNTLKFTDGTVASRNVVLPYNTVSKTVSQKLAVVSDISGSTIYVSIPVSSISSDVVFTSGYGYSSKNPALPGTVFVSDCAYAIGLDSSGSEAAFVLSGGSFTNPFGITMTFALNASVIPAGVASDLTVTPTVMQNGSDITASVLSDISWKLSLMLGSVTIEESVTNTLSVSAADALPDSYTLYIAATLNGIAYDDSATIVCKDTLDGMISVSGANISGAISDSGVFVTGRNLTIPSLYVGQHELTQKEYLEYCYYAHSGKQPAASYTGDNYPACFVSWYDAIVYCNLRSIAEGLTPAYSLEGETDPRLWDEIVAGSDSNAGKYCGPLANTESWNNITFDTSANGWRMPVEAEWEYLARGGNLDSASQTTYAGSNTWEEVAWTAGNASEPHLVKQKAANSLGLYDMSGNVFEYVWDWYGGDITSSVGITGYDRPVKTSDNDYRRIVRGGGYTYSSDYAKVSDRRVYNTPEMRWGNCGVRIVRNVN